MSAELAAILIKYLLIKYGLIAAILIDLMATWYFVVKLNRNPDLARSQRQFILAVIEILITANFLLIYLLIFVTSRSRLADLIGVVPFGMLLLFSLLTGWRAYRSFRVHTNDTSQ